MEQFNIAPQQQENGIDIKDLLFKILGFWPFIVASMIIGLSVSFVVNRYSRNIYELATVLNVEEAENPLGSSGVSLAFNWGGMNKLESKEAVLRSYTLHENVARKLGWEVSYYGTGRLIESELYKTSPYEVLFDFDLRDIFRDSLIFFLYSRGFFVPYLERLFLRSLTPAASRLPRTI